MKIKLLFLFFKNSNKRQSEKLKYEKKFPPGCINFFKH